MADLRWIDALPGRKIISKGNHDLWWKSIQKMNGLFPTIRFLQNTACLAENCAIAGTRGWISPGTEGFDDHDEKIYRRELLRLRMSLEEAVKLKAEAILCSLHYPPSNDKLQRSGFMDMLAEYGVNCCVYGHLHGEKAFRKGFQGSMDGVSYRLVSLDYIDAEPVKIWGA